MLTMSKCSICGDSGATVLRENILCHTHCSEKIVYVKTTHSGKIFIKIRCKKCIKAPALLLQGNVPKQVCKCI